MDHFAADEEASFAIARDVIASLNIDEDVTEYGEETTEIGNKVDIRAHRVTS